jgi:hypothetical protein
MALHKKLEELTGQNQELAKAVAMRIRQYESQGSRDLPDDNDDEEAEQITPESSPPPSPNKFTPRHNHLESETLKSSLGHAHRMIQNLKSTIHREKTEKIELKRMLQEARDEVEQRRRENNAPKESTKRLKTKDNSFRKPARPDLLGAGRKEKSSVEMEIHDTDWEDNAGHGSPTRSIMAAPATRSRSGAVSPPDEPSDVYQTATEAEDGFETANERATATESEAFQTGVESMADDSSDDSADLTETENNVQTTPRTRRVPSLMMAKARDRNPYHSTASATSDEDETDGGFPSPSQSHISGRRVRSKRSVLRRIRPSGEAPMASSSRPSSARNSPAPSFEEQPVAREGQSLFAELAELEGGDEEEDGGVVTSQASTPRMGPSSDSRRPSEITLDSLPRPVMVDSGMMTEPWEPSTPVAAVAGAAVAGAAVAGAAGAAVSALSDGPTTPKRSVDREITAEAEETPKHVSSGTQWTPLKPGMGDNDHLANVPTPPKMAWDERAVETQLVEASTQAEPAEMGIAAISSQETRPTAPIWPALAISYLPGSFTEPVKHELPTPEIPEMSFSSIASQTTEPVVHIEPVRELPKLSLSSHFIHHTEPVLAQLPEPVVEEVYMPELAVSTISSLLTEPVKAKPAPAPEPIMIPAPIPEPVIPDLSVALLDPAFTVPVKAVPAPAPEPIVITAPAPEPIVPELSISLLEPAITEPVKAEPAPAPEPIIIPAPVPEPVLPDLSISLLDPTFTVPVKALPAPAPEPIVIPAPVPEPVIPDLSISLLDPAFTEPITPKVAVLPPRPVPSISTLRFVETQPVRSVVRAIPSMSNFAIQTDPIEEPKAAAAAVVIHEDEQDEPNESARELSGTSISERRTSTGLALNDISGNALLPQSDRQLPSFVSSDQGSQTILSSKQIDQILMDRDSVRPVSSADGRHKMEMAALGAVGAAAGAAAVSPFATPKLRPRLQPQQSARSGASSQMRPDTATSQNSSFSVHPPLPADHREAIAAAEKRSIDIPPPTPSPGTMGPPLAPASAYRVNVHAAPRTPNDQSTGPGSARTVSTQARMRRESQSQMSRRSSVSSFASELEERFNMNPYAGPMPHGYGANTDPRMIQAITQTMIGEFLWKYTRKTGSSDMSSTRHRRYFWVHPYTRTLYWSEHDPQTAGKSQLRTKSVPIEAVRVIPDDNPYPPGLHCRSLEVVSPGRKVRFTATTSQRHETWFNALSYLLLRESNEACDDADAVTLDDIDEFNPGFRSSSRQTARMSLSSYNSRTVRQAPKAQRAASAMSMRSTGGTPGRASPALSNSGQNSSLQVPEDPPQRSSSRLSTILNSSIRGSIASLKGRHGQAASLHDESIRDQPSMENLSHHHHDDEDRLENVRACCDGKHDVGSLSRNSRYSPRVDRIHSHH